MLCPPYAPDPLVQGWLERHRGAVSFTLHMIGIPPTILGALLVPVYTFLFSLPIFILAVFLFFGGYALQFLGHALEGSDPGEVILLKRKLGWSDAEVPAASKSRRSVA
jgi:hypothetical protein